MKRLLNGLMLLIGCICAITGFVFIIIATFNDINMGYVSGALISFIICSFSLCIANLTNTKPIIKEFVVSKEKELKNNLIITDEKLIQEEEIFIVSNIQRQQQIYENLIKTNAPRIMVERAKLILDLTISIKNKVRAYNNGNKTE